MSDAALTLTPASHRVHGPRDNYRTTEALAPDGRRYRLVEVSDGSEFRIDEIALEVVVRGATTWRRIGHGTARAMERYAAVADAFRRMAPV